MFKIKIEKDGEKFCNSMKTDEAFVILTKNKKGNTVMTVCGDGDDIIAMLRECTLKILSDTFAF